MGLFKTFKDGIIEQNPTFIQVIGMCPVLAVTTGATNGLGMGLSTTAVLVCSNLVISLIRKFVPETVRIPCFVVVIASFVTIVQFLLQAFMRDLNQSLGIFIPLIVVNCLILARAEAFASKNNPIRAIADGLGMGIGFTVALVIIGCIRELLGTGMIFNIKMLPEIFPNTIIMILPPGAFFTLAGLMALINYLIGKKQAS